MCGMYEGGGRPSGLLEEGWQGGLKGGGSSALLSRITEINRWVWTGLFVGSGGP